MSENTNNKINILDILKTAEATPKEARTVRVSSAKKTTIFKSSLYKKGMRTETSLIDDCIVDAVKNLHAAGKNEVSFYALTRLFQALNPNHVFKTSSRIADHVNAKSDDVFSKFFEITPNKLVFKDSIIVALQLDQVEKAEKAEKKVETKLRKKA